MLKAMRGEIAVVLYVLALLYWLPILVRWMEGLR